MNTTALDHALAIVISGGPVMVAIAITSLLLYKCIIGLLLFVRRVRFDELADERLRLHLNSAAGAAARTPVDLQVQVINETLGRFRQLVRSRLNYAHALIIAAPLFGLLGTVEGMLDTFRSLSLQFNHEFTRTVADGISRALITTNTGLFVAIPALFLINWIKREFQRHELLIIHRKMQLLTVRET